MFHRKEGGTMNATARPQPVHGKLRTWLLITASCTMIFGILHHVDHVVRGNHSGWPFAEAVTPFTFSLLIYALLVPGLYLTAKGRLMARYWLFTALLGLTLLVWIHFVPTRYHEAPIRDIYGVYDSPVVGFLAVADLTALIASVVVLAGMAIQALREGTP
jgi:hypothetical protein